MATVSVLEQKLKPEVITCKTCSYTWAYKGKMVIATCPSCRGYNRTHRSHG